MGRHTRKTEVRQVDGNLDGEARRVLYGAIISLAGAILAGLKTKGIIDGTLELTLMNVIESTAELALLLGLVYARSKVGVLVEVVKPFVEPFLPTGNDEPIGALTDSEDGTNAKY